MRFAIAFFISTVALYGAERVYHLDCASSEPRLAILRSVLNVRAVRCDQEFVVREFATMEALREKIHSLMLSNKMLRLEEIGFLTAQYPEICAEPTSFAYVIRGGLYGCRSARGRVTVYPLHKKKLDGPPFRLVTLKD